MPPGAPELKEGFFRKTRWADEPVVAARGQQDNWYLWQTHVAWAHAWDRQAPRWIRPLEQTQRDIAALTGALLDFARKDEEDFARRSAELYRKRVGVSYLLPAGAGGMNQFYEQVVRRLRDQMVRDGLLHANPNVSEVIRVLIGADTWPEAFRLSVEQYPDHAVSFMREKIKTEVKKFLRAAPPGEQPILPKMHDLLLEAAGHGRGTVPMIDPDYLEGLPRQARRAAARQLHAAGQRPDEGPHQLPCRRR